jgi:hypothetical protein
LTKIPTLGWAKQDFWGLGAVIAYLSIDEVSCFFDQNSNHIINQDSTEIIWLEKGKVHISQRTKWHFDWNYG